MNLQEVLAQRIRRQGPLTLADYIVEVLTHPEFGYYMTRDPFGTPQHTGGDFITAPEISQIFGELVGLWCVDHWQRCGQPNPCYLIELGPGRGTLLADALRAAKLAPDFLAAVELHLVEVSPVLKRLQSKALLEHSPRWHQNLGEVPEGPALIVANEFLDALPVRQFEKSTEGWCERLVTLDPETDALTLALAPPSRATEHVIPNALRCAPEGSVVEVSSAAASTAAEIARRVAEFGGGALILDYGAAEAKTGATLQALRQHKRHDILEAPGTADLTAHVCFAEVRTAAETAGGQCHGPIAQGEFLMRLGIEARAAALFRHASPLQAQSIQSAVERLTSEDQMGSLFKALAITGPGDPLPAGFVSPA